MRPHFFLLVAGLIFFLLCPPLLIALDHDGGDKVTLPETTDFAKKFNKFMEPISFGVGSEPGFDSNAVYIYLMYKYSPNYSWMTKFNMESSIKDEKDIDFKTPSNGIDLSLNKQKIFSLSLLPMVRHFKNMDLGFGLSGKFYHFELEDLNSSVDGNFYLDLNRDVLTIGPIIYLHWQYPLSEHVDFGGTTEFSPIMLAYLKDKYRVSYYFDELDMTTNNNGSDFGIGIPSISQEIYFTFLRFVNLSAGLKYDFFTIGKKDIQISHDASLRLGLALLKKPKGGFLNYLVGVFYEREWTFMDIKSDHIYEQEGRWIFCVGASG